MKKLLLFLLTFVLTLGCFFALACGGDDNNGQNKPQEQGVYTPEKLESNGVDLSEYKIIYSANALVSQQNAAKQLSDYLYKATGIRIDYVTDTAQEQEKEIVIGNTNRAICQNADFAVLKDDGYKLYVEGDKMLIAGNQRGALYGVFTFLEKLGYRFYTDKWEKIPDADDVFVPKTLNEQYVPQIEFRDTMFPQSISGTATAFNTKIKVNSAFARNPSEEWGGAIGYVGGSKYLVHTFKYFIPYDSSRPFAFASGYPGNENASNENHIYDQPCLTNEENFEICLQNARALLASNKANNLGGKYLSISENDSGYRCKCANCQASFEEFGYSGTLLKFVNGIAEAIKDEYPEILVEHLVYSDKNLPKGGIVPAENVVLRLCTDGCSFHEIGTCDGKTSGWNDASMSSGIFGSVFSQWTTFGNPVLIWYYCSNYNKVAFYTPNIQNYLYNINLFAKNGACGIYNESYGSGEFTDLRIYLLAKLMWNPYMSQAEFDYHFNDFMQGYYGDGWEGIKEYMDYTIELVGDNHFGPSSVIKYEYPVSQDYAKNKEYINNCAEMWDRALNGATGDGENKEESTLNHVIKSKLCFDMYRLYTTMEADMSYYADEDERIQLEIDCRDLFNNMILYGCVDICGNEKVSKDNIPDFTISPWYWYSANRALGVDSMPLR